MKGSDSTRKNELVGMSAWKSGDKTCKTGRNEKISMLEGMLVSVSASGK